MQTPEQLIGKSPFLSLLPGELQAQVVAKMTEHSYAFGDRIVAEGEPADAFFLILTGKARILKTTQEGDEVPLHALAEGESFGEIGLLTGGARTATVRATGQMTVLRLARADFEAVLADSPDVREFIHAQLRQRQVQGFLRQYTEFSGAPAEAMEALLKALVMVSLPARQTIFQQGDEPDGMYIIEDGHARVFARTNGDERDLAFLRPGDFFGELSLLAGNPRTASVEAASECRLLKLEPRDYARLMDQYPRLRAVVETRMSSYRAKSGSARMPLDFWCATQEGDAPTPTEAPRAPGQPQHAIPADNELTSTFESIATDRAAPFSRQHFVQQVDASDSGAATLAMVARHLGRQTSIARIRDMLRPANHGAATSERICETAQALGLRARLLQAGPESLNTMPLPCPALMESDHWVLLTEIDGDRLRVADPASGIAWISRANFLAGWSRLAIEIQPGRAPDSRATSVWSWLPAALRSHGTTASRSVIVSLLFGIAVAGGIVLLRQTLNAMRAQQPLSGFAVIAAVAVAIGILAVLRHQIIGSLAARVNRSLASHTLDRLVGLSVEFMDHHRQQELENRLRSSRDLRDTVVRAHLHGLTDLLILAVLVCTAALLDAPLAGLLLLTVVLAAAVAVIAGPRLLGGAAHRLALGQNACDDMQSDLLVGLETIKSAAAEGPYTRSLNERFGDLTQALRQWQRRVAGLQALVLAVWTAGFLAIAYIALGQAPLALSPGGVVAMLAVVVLCLLPLRGLSHLVATGVRWQAQAGPLEQILANTGRPTISKRDSQQVRGLAGKLEVRHATLYYSSPNAPAALRDLALQVASGEHIAIVGRSGSGKSSVINCLAGMVQAQKGTVLIDDVDIRDLDDASLRQHMGIVPQHAHVFDGTVTANIALGDDSPDLTRVQQAARDAGLHDAIRDLPDTYDTRLGRRGWMLPAGQQRALSIARALYQQPDLLLLDDPTADMDVETQSLVWENIHSRYADRTVIMVTSHLHLARHADRILVLERGHVVEAGSHVDLIKRHGVYFHLCSGVDNSL